MEFLSRVDHLVFATLDLDHGVEEIETLLGIRATPGGHHPGWGTRNALIGLGSTTYLEIIAPDLEQPPPKTPRPFGIDNLNKSRLVAWAANGSNLGRLTREAARKGVCLGEVKSGGRQRSDGVLLSWQFTDPWIVVADGIIPFFIDWGESPHPARTVAKGSLLIALRAEHPDPQRIQRILGQLGLDLSVQSGSTPALIAVISSPRGRVELR